MYDFKTREFRQNRDLYNKTAAEWTRLYAISETDSISTVSTIAKSKSPLKIIVNSDIKDNKENISDSNSLENTFKVNEIKETTISIESENNKQIEAPPKVMKSLLSKRKIQI